ncbi:hypothetical protein [Pontibacillus sp. HMF3514]|uniref:hypothetical protein n=1 Tax=Pontibacillus sp. HMF3514 TaxID=2692425 RepID=UPI00131F8F13|nr:hypothetical protein [Pontibacillus sp. HMF3514]QHE52691.1 hypothetical protein GS400_11900 [Pontibacillus sp. HMF3514]
MGLMAGCVNNASSEEVNKELEKNINRLQDSVLKMEEKIDAQTATIKKLEERIASNEKTSSLISDSYAKKTDLTYYDELISQTMKSETAILHDAKIKGDQLLLRITYAEKVDDDQAPNGFNLNQFEDATLSIDKKKPIYLLETPSKLVRVEWKEVMNESGLIELFKNDGEVVFIREIYIP